MIASTVFALLNLILLPILIYSTRSNPDSLKNTFLFFYSFSLLSLLLNQSIDISRQLLLYIPLANLWLIAYIFKQAGYIFYIIFLYKLNPKGMSKGFTISISILIIFGIVVYTFFYTIIPQIIELLVIVYSISRLLHLRLTIHKNAGQKSISMIVSILLYSSSLFFIGLIMDILETIPYTQPDFTLLYFNFHPLYLFVICIGFIYWLRLERKNIYIDTTGRSETLLEEYGLSFREREIAELILKGLTNRQIAEQLYISESTVKKHINNFFKKLSICSRWELVRICSQEKNIELQKNSPIVLLFLV
jgi:DNA-binding CsgD family transcriptional regulator